MIGGCKTDEVPGIQGVGEGYALKYIKGTMNIKGKLYSRIVKGKRTIKRNRLLVKLPFAKTTVPDIQPGVEINFKAFQEICIRYGFASFLKQKKYNEWKQYFGGHHV